MYSAILYLDPGLRTGWASWESGVFSAGICDPADAWEVMEIWANKHAGSRALIGCERFTITAQTATKDQTAMHWALELTGVARYQAGRCGLTFENSQTPAAAKRFATDEKLRRAGFYTPGKEDHARDASRHLLLKAAKLRLVTL